MKKKEKVLFYIFLSTHEEGTDNSDMWIDKIKTFRNLNVDWWVNPNGASHIGLAYQSILDTDSIEEAKEIAEYISDQFNNDCLIVLKKGLVSRKEPIGHNNEEVFWDVGRYFDKLVSKNKKGIHIYDKG